VRIAISNIAWNPEAEQEVISLMGRYGVEGVEIAPTKIWPRPLEASATEVDGFSNTWRGRGHPIIALQSLLFGRPDLTLFDGEQDRAAMVDYLRGIISLAGRLGAGALVFGSPKNRIAGNRSIQEVNSIAARFFSEMAEWAVSCNTCFCLEPNPAEYGCDYVRTVAEALEVIRATNHPGLRLNLDTGIMTINGEPLAETIVEALPYIGHLHLSEPQLGVVGSGPVDHERIAYFLRHNDYRGWVSIEMRSGSNASDSAAIETALSTVVRYYR
jgi:D-psicose/D-tagatose/L-ribulose 3-epimerase